MVSQRARKDTKDRQKVEEPKITQLELPKTTENKQKVVDDDNESINIVQIEPKKLVAKLVIIH